MLINLSEAFTVPGRCLVERFTPENEQIAVAGESFRVRKWEPFEVKAVCTEEHRADLHVRGALTALAVCDRCLQPVEVELEIDFKQDVYAPDAVPETVDRDAQLFMEGYQLSVDTLIESEAIMNWPLKVLCREDCKGICPVCGKNLNEGECGCDTFTPDPRLAAVKDIFLANKEV